jgi:hypothetical protein
VRFSANQFIAAASIATALFVSACVRGGPATDTSDPGFPFGPTSLTVRPLAYNQDIKAILDSDCSQCHSRGDARGDYSVSTYDSTISDQRAGDARSSLVVDSSPGGSMYQYWSGDRTTRATMIFRWAVVYNLAQSR